MKLFKRADFDLIIIGSGSGGGVGANLAASLGKKVAMFENDAIGGECPNWACVPTKALLHAAHIYESVKDAAQYGTTVGDVKLNYHKVKAWKDLVVSRTGSAQGERIFEDEGITVIKGEAKFTGKHSVVCKGKTYTAKNFLIASGTTNFVPPVPGLKTTGFISFREAINLTAPPKSIFIVGGGPIGCEFAQAFMSFGSQVYIADAFPRLLAREDSDVSELITAIFESKGTKVLTNCMITKTEKKGNKKLVHYKLNGHSHSVEVDEILVAAGKKARTDIGLEAAGVKYSPTGIITDKTMQTSAKHIYAAGDVVGPYQFTHTASYQSHLAAHNMYHRQKLKADYSYLPRCVFVRPEVASAGMTQEEAVKKGIKVKVGLSPISILGRANTTNDLNGFVKVVTNEKGVLIGACIVAARAGEMIHELSLAIKLKATASDIADTIHAFPTFSEAIRIACLNVQ